MYEPLQERTTLNIEAVKKHIGFSSDLRAMLTDQVVRCRDKGSSCFNLDNLCQRAPSVMEWRIIDHCAAVTRLYAIYEKFVEDLLSEYLQFVERNVPYSKLDQKFQTQHRKMIGQILLDLDRERYKNTLRFESILDDIKQIFSGGSYRILPQAMLSHDQNLRIVELANLFERCGISNVKEWLDKHRAVKNYFKVSGQQDKAESKLGQLIQYRNDAAHGGLQVDDLLGKDALLDFASFIDSVCKALTECVQAACLKIGVDQGILVRTGTITERFSDNRVVAIVRNNSFKIGDALYLAGDAYCYRVKILSLRDNDEPKETITILEDKEIGFAFDIEPIKRADLYLWPQRTS